jgi:hypothetical protein
LPPSRLSGVVPGITQMVIQLALQGVLDHHLGEPNRPPRRYDTRGRGAHPGYGGAPTPRVLPGQLPDQLANLQSRRAGAYEIRARTDNRLWGHSG